MRNRLLISILTATAACCGDASSEEDRVDDTRDTSTRMGAPQAGGSTSDFGGRCSCDVVARELSLSEEDPALGLSAADVLGRLEGEYSLAMVWGDSCADESPTAEGCTDEPPDFTGSETQVQIVIQRAGTTARVEDCASEASDASMPECRVTWLIVPVTGTLTTTDGLLDETFELELQTKSVDEISLGQERLPPSELGGALPSRMPQLDYLSWSFGLTQSDAWFEVFGVVLYPSTSRSRARAVAPEDGRMPEGHSWGVAVEIERAKQ